MTLRNVMLIGILISLLGGAWPIGSVQAGYQTSPYSISLGPDQATAGPGEFVEFTVRVSALLDALDRFSGSVLVLIPDGLTVTGQPYCQTGCGQPAVDVDTEVTQLEASFVISGDESASLSFQVMVGMDATVGTSYSLTAYLLGGVNTAGSSETAFATLTVSETAPSSGPVDDRYAYLDVTPRLLRVAPGGSALYFVQPGFWGDWSANLPEYTVELRFPSGVDLPSDPICGPRQSVVPEVSTCDVSTEKLGDGSILVTANPGFVSVNSNGLYVTVEFQSTLSIDTFLQIDVSLSMSGDVPASAQNIEQSLGALVVDSSEISLSNESGTISGRYEAHSGYFPQGDACSISDSSFEYELSLFEWGGADVALARMELPTGRIGPASDGTGSDVCIIEFRFEGVPEYSVYMVAETAAGQTDVCRACVWGLITPSQDADQVIVREG